MADDLTGTSELAFNHAWQWFSLHANQRMQTFNFFLAATAFLVAGYAALLAKLPLVALVVSIAGAWIAFWFIRLDNRTRQLIDAGEAILRVYQEELARKTNIPTLEILRIVHNPSSGASLYRVVIAVIEWTVVVLFVLAAGYAAYRLICEH